MSKNENKTEEVLFAGFGGQGVLSMGQILAYSGMMEGKEVCWMPSYGPEMRGGTANCVVIVSNEEIISPIISSYDTVVALNQPSVEKFEKAVKPGGTMIYETSTVDVPPTRKDITIIPVSANETALKMGFQKGFNMVVLGAFIEARKTISADGVEKGLKKALPERYHKMIPQNMEAFAKGAAFAN
ncbi:MAG: 2-oxoacid:acceptor oxidoreductase family protein [Ignavibacteria bacterium]|jgi:2-oxoglutarate ferredoxin oxidoreductase subunit gamma|nr:2-oxoacid:acceptor oxidoreductase family protein [Ignavibacteria bacterium]